MGRSNQNRRLEWLALSALIALIGLASSCNLTSRSPTPVAAPSVAPAPEPSGPAPASPLAPGARTAQPSSDRIPIDADDAVWGSPTAAITLVEFSDLECPFCARVQPTLSELSKAYGPDKLRIVFKHNPLPFHKQARPAALFAQAVRDSAGPEAAFAFMQRCFDHYPTLSHTAFLGFVREIGLDPAAIEALAQHPDVAARVERDMELAAKLDATGTPAFFVNGVKISGAQPLDKFLEVTKVEIAKADALLASGIPPADVYRARVAENFREPPPPAAKPAADEEPDLATWKIPVAGAPTRGPRDAIVTIVAFYDYQCPFCKRVQETIDAVLARYPDDVRLVVRQNPLPFHERAYPAARVALEARAQLGDAGFFEISRRLYASFPKLEDADLLAVARDLSLDVRRVERVLKKGGRDKTIDADMDLAADFKARGVPHFFVNGVRISGAQPLDAFEAAVERERERANALVAKGVPRARVYAELMKTAQEPSPPESKQVAAIRDSPTRGPANAPYVIEVFSDFECPFCKRVEGTLAELDQRYPGQIRWIWRNLPLPFHRSAKPAARAALEARAQQGEKAFWSMHDALFESQGTDPGLTDDAIVDLAARMNLDVARFKAALANGVHDAAIDADVQAANAAGITGTPAFLVNGYYIAGAQPLRAFERAMQYSKKKPLPKKK